MKTPYSNKEKKKKKKKTKKKMKRKDGKVALWHAQHNIIIAHSYYSVQYPSNIWMLFMFIWYTYFMNSSTQHSVVCREL